MQRRNSKKWSGDGLFHTLTTAAALVAVVLLVLMVLELFEGALPILNLGFVTGVNWNPVAGREEFGVLPYILGTLVTSSIAFIIGVPVSLGIAIFLAEMSPRAV